MRFIVRYKPIDFVTTLYYNAEENSFATEPHLREVSFDVLVNDLNLAVGENVVNQVSGLSPFKGWIPTDQRPQAAPKGALELATDKEPGFIYRLNGGDRWPEYFNKTERWVCIGKPGATGTSVEFLENCLAVLLGNQLAALWLKPRFIPPLPKSFTPGLKLIRP